MLGCKIKKAKWRMWWPSWEKIDTTKDWNNINWWDCIES